jgi:hypothetical protein
MGTMGKNKAALFELIRDPGVNQKSMPVVQQARQVGGPRLGEPQAEPPIAVAREPKPRVVLSAAPKVDVPLEPPPPPPPSGNSVLFERGPRLDFGKKLTLSTSVISAGVAVVVLLLIIVAATAYRRGEARAEQAARTELERAGVRDPLRADIPLNHAILSNEPGSQAGIQPPVQPVRQPISQPPPKPAPAAGVSGPLVDTRESGLNYCVAASLLPKDEAERAARFLTENGLPAAPVWVESDAGEAKNRPAYRVYILKGLSGSDVNRRAPGRTDLEAELMRLGKIWQREHRGNVNFAQTYWEKKR